MYGTWATVALMYQLLQFRLVWEDLFSIKIDLRLEIGTIFLSLNLHLSPLSPMVNRTFKACVTYPYTATLKIANALYIHSPLYRIVKVKSVQTLAEIAVKSSGPHLKVIFMMQQ